MCGPFTPMVFMGEEWGASTPWQFFTDFDEPALAQAVRVGRREEFAEHGWDAEEVPDPQAVVDPGRLGPGLGRAGGAGSRAAARLVPVADLVAPQHS